MATQGGYAVTVERARHVTSAGGWVQPGSVSVGVFHDLDQDGVRQPGDTSPEAVAASAGSWRALTTTTEGLDQTTTEVGLGAVGRLLDADGNLRIRYVADLGKPFDLALDRVAVTLVNRR